MSDIFQVPAVITKISTMSNSLRLHVDTQETLSPESMTRLLNLYNQLGYFTMSVHQIQAQDIIDLKPIESDSRKSPGQRLRSVLYRNWEKNNEGHKDFPMYYEIKMERIINYLKEKLE